MFIEQSHDTQIKQIFQVGGLIRFLKDSCLNIDHVNKLHDEDGQRRLAKKLKSHIKTSETAQRKNNTKIRKKKPGQLAAKSKPIKDARIHAPTEEGSMRIFTVGTDVDALSEMHLVVT